MHSSSTRVFCVALLLLCVALASTLFAQTPVTSSITTNTTWNAAGSPYEVDTTPESFRVEAGATLTIDTSGGDVVVNIINGNAQAMRVEGTINVSGGSSPFDLYFNIDTPESRVVIANTGKVTSSAPVYFRHDATTPFNGLTFEAGQTLRSDFSNDVYLSGGYEADTPVVIIEDSSQFLPQFSDLQIDGCTGALFELHGESVDFLVDGSLGSGFSATSGGSYLAHIIDGSSTYRYFTFPDTDSEPDNAGAYDTVLIEGMLTLGTSGSEVDWRFDSAYNVLFASGAAVLVENGSIHGYGDKDVIFDTAQAPTQEIDAWSGISFQITGPGIPTGVNNQPLLLSNLLVRNALNVSLIVLDAPVTGARDISVSDVRFERCQSFFSDVVHFRSFPWYSIHYDRIECDADGGSGIWAPVDSGFLLDGGLQGIGNSTFKRTILACNKSQLEAQLAMHSIGNCVIDHNAPPAPFSEGVIVESVTSFTLSDSLIQGYDTGVMLHRGSTGDNVSVPASATQTHVIRDSRIIADAFGVRLGGFPSPHGDNRILEISDTRVDVSTGGTGFDLTEVGTDDDLSLTRVAVKGGLNGVLVGNDPWNYWTDPNQLAQNSRIDIFASHFVDCDKGIVDYRSTGANSNAYVHATFCNFQNNGTYGVEDTNAIANTQAIECYWGDASGPSGVGPGTGVLVSANVDFSPFGSVSTINLMQPRILEARTQNSTSVKVIFSESMDPTTATTLSEYEIDGATPTAAVLSTTNKTDDTVTLTLGAALVGTDAAPVVKVIGVKDIRNEFVSTASPNNQAALDGIAPELVSAQVAGNSIYLTFSEEMGDPLYSSGYDVILAQGTASTTGVLSGHVLIGDMTYATLASGSSTYQDMTTYHVDQSSAPSPVVALNTIQLSAIPNIYDAFGNRAVQTTALSVYSHVKDATSTVMMASEAMSISSIATTPVAVWEIYLQDQGSTDGVDTIVTGLHFKCFTMSNQAQADDFEWSLAGETITPLVAFDSGVGTIDFSGLDIVASDGGSAQIISLQMRPKAQVAVPDNFDQSELTLSLESIDYAPNSSAVAGLPYSKDLSIFVDVAASAVVIPQAPNSFIYVNSTYLLTARAEDANGNLDTEVDEIFTISWSGASTVTNGSAAATSGVVSFESLSLGSPHASGESLTIADDPSIGPGPDITDAMLQLELYNVDDADSRILASATLTEPTIIDSVTGSAAYVDVFDFTIEDHGTSDQQPTLIYELEIKAGSTSANVDMSAHSWLLKGPDIDPAGVAPTFVPGAGIDGALTFSEMNLSIADGTSETYTLSLQLAVSHASMPDNTTIDFTVSVAGVVSDGGTTIAPSSTLTSGPLIYTVVATEMRVIGSMPSWVYMDTPLPIVVGFTDANGNIDLDADGESMTVSWSGTATLVSELLTSSLGILDLEAASAYLSGPAESHQTLTISDDAASGPGPDLTDLAITPVGLAGLKTIQSFPYSPGIEASTDWVPNFGHALTPSGSEFIFGQTATDRPALTSYGAWALSLGGEYKANTVAWLQSPIFDISTQTDVALYFDLWMDSEGDQDGLTLEYSKDGGINWAEVPGIMPAFNNGAISMIPVLPNSACWTGQGLNTGTSIPVYLDLTHYQILGANDLRLRFVFTSGATNHGKGPSIGNLRIDAKTTDPMAGSPLFPSVENFRLTDGAGNDEDLTHVVDHTPKLHWDFTGHNSYSLQDAYEVEVATDSSFTTLLWTDSGANRNETRSVTYAGSTLNDGESYSARVRVKNHFDLWSSWAEVRFHMNSVPEVVADTPGWRAPYQAANSPVTHPVTLLDIESGFDPTNAPALSWWIPEDRDGDELQYELELTDYSQIPAVVLTYSSATYVANTGGFSVGDGTFWNPMPKSGASGLFHTWSQFEIPIADGFEFGRYWRVRSFDGFEWSSWSTEWRVFAGAPHGFSGSLTDSLGNPVANETISAVAIAADGSARTLSIGSGSDETDVNGDFNLDFGGEFFYPGDWLVFFSSSGAASIVPYFTPWLATAPTDIDLVEGALRIGRGSEGGVADISAFSYDSTDNANLLWTYDDQLGELTFDGGIEVFEINLDLDLGTTNVSASGTDVFVVGDSVWSVKQSTVGMKSLMLNDTSALNISDQANVVIVEGLAGDSSLSLVDEATLIFSPQGASAFYSFAGDLTVVESTLFLGSSSAQPLFTGFEVIQGNVTLDRATIRNNVGGYAFEIRIGAFANAAISQTIFDGARLNTDVDCIVSTLDACEFTGDVHTYQLSWNSVSQLSDPLASNCVFSSTTLPGSGAYNVAAPWSTANPLRFENATGVAAGEAYESDPSDLIFWDSDPRTPENLIAIPGKDTNGFGKVLLRWEASTVPGAEYLVYQRDNLLSPFVVVSPANLTASELLLDTLTAGNDYQFYVTSVENGLESTASQIVEVTPDEPSIELISPSEIENNGSAALTIFGKATYWPASQNPTFLVYSGAIAAPQGLHVLNSEALNEETFIASLNAIDASIGTWFVQIAYDDPFDATGMTSVVLRKDLDVIAGVDERAVPTLGLTSGQTEGMQYGFTGANATWTFEADANGGYLLDLSTLDIGFSVDVSDGTTTYTAGTNLATALPAIFSWNGFELTISTAMLTLPNGRATLYVGVESEDGQSANTSLSAWTGTSLTVDGSEAFRDTTGHVLKLTSPDFQNIASYTTTSVELVHTESGENASTFGDGFPDVVGVGGSGNDLEITIDFPESNLDGYFDVRVNTTGGWQDYAQVLRVVTDSEIQSAMLFAMYFDTDVLSPSYQVSASRSSKSSKSVSGGSSATAPTVLPSLLREEAAHMVTPQGFDVNTGGYTISRTDLSFPGFEHVPIIRRTYHSSHAQVPSPYVGQGWSAGMLDYRLQVLWSKSPEKRLAYVFSTGGGGITWQVDSSGNVTDPYKSGYFFKDAVIEGNDTRSVTIVEVASGNSIVFSLTPFSDFKWLKLRGSVRAEKLERLGFSDSRHQLENLRVSKCLTPSGRYFTFINKGRHHEKVESIRGPKGNSLKFDYQKGYVSVSLYTLLLDERTVKWNSGGGKTLKSVEHTSSSTYVDNLNALHSSSISLTTSSSRVLEAYGYEKRRWNGADQWLLDRHVQGHPSEISRGREIKWHQGSNGAYAIVLQVYDNALLEVPSTLSRSPSEGPLYVDDPNEASFLRRDSRTKGASHASGQWRYVFSDVEAFFEGGSSVDGKTLTQSDPSDFETVYTFDGARRIEEIRHNGVTRKHLYDTAGRLISRTTVDVNSNDLAPTVSYTYTGTKKEELPAYTLTSQGIYRGVNQAGNNTVEIAHAGDSRLLTAIFFKPSYAENLFPAGGGSTKAIEYLSNGLHARFTRSGEPGSFHLRVVNLLKGQNGYVAALLDYPGPKLYLHSQLKSVMGFIPTHVTLYTNYEALPYARYPETVTANADGKLAKTIYKYSNAQGRVLLKSVKAASGLLTEFVYDNNGVPGVVAPDGRGDLTERITTYPGQSPLYDEFQYNERSQLLAAHIDSEVIGTQKFIGYEYEEDPLKADWSFVNRSWTSSPSQVSTTQYHEHNGFGQLTKTSQYPLTETKKATVYTYDAIGRPKSVTYPSIGEAQNGAQGMSVFFYDQHGARAVTFDRYVNDATNADVLPDSSQIDDPNYFTSGLVGYPANDPTKLDVVGWRMHLTVRDELARVREEHVSLYSFQDRLVAEYEYDWMGRPTWSKSSSGLETINLYDFQGRLEYTYQRDGRETLGFERFGYDALGRVTSYDGPRTGDELHKYHDPWGRVKYQGPETLETTVDSNSLISGKQAPALKYVYYDDPSSIHFGLLKDVLYLGDKPTPTAGEVSYTYDEYGRLETEVVPLERMPAPGSSAATPAANKKKFAITKYEYEGAKAIDSIKTIMTDPAGEKWETHTHVSGAVIFEKDPVGNSVKYEYNEYGDLREILTRERRTDQTFPVVQWTENFEHDTYGNVVKATSSRHPGVESKSYYDTFGQLVKSEEKVGAVVKATTTTSYDLVGRPVLLEESLRDNSESRRSFYEYLPHVSSATLPGSWQRILKTGSAATAPAGLAFQEAVYTDRAGRTVATEQSKTKVRTLYEYNAANDLKLEKRYGSGLQISTDYDPKGLPTKRVISPITGTGGEVYGTEIESFSWDAWGNMIEAHNKARYRSLGGVATTADAFTSSWQYNSRHLPTYCGVLTPAVSFGALQNGANLSRLEAFYDERGFMTHEVYPSWFERATSTPIARSTILREPNRLGLTKTLQIESIGSSDPKSVVLEKVVYSGSRLLERHYGATGPYAATRSIFAYGSSGLPESVAHQHQTSSGFKDMWKFTRAYSEELHVTSDSYGHRGGRGHDYAHDASGRLRSANFGGVPGASSGGSTLRHYLTDPVDNITAMTERSYGAPTIDGISGILFDSFDFATPVGSSQVSHVEGDALIRYDSGSVKKDNATGLSYAYNYRGQLVYISKNADSDFSVADDIIAEYWYDALGRRLLEVGGARSLHSAQLAFTQLIPRIDPNDLTTPSCEFENDVLGGHSVRELVYGPGARGEDTLIGRFALEGRYGYEADFVYEDLQGSTIGTTEAKLSSNSHGNLNTPGRKLEYHYTPFGTPLKHQVLYSGEAGLKDLGGGVCEQRSAHPVSEHSGNWSPTPPNYDGSYARIVLEPGNGFEIPTIPVGAEVQVWDGNSRFSGTVAFVFQDDANTHGSIPVTPVPGELTILPDGNADVGAFVASFNAAYTNNPANITIYDFNSETKIARD